MTFSSPPVHREPVTAAPSPGAATANAPVAHQSFSSFTGASGVRYPAPDVARGFMLVLIAVANVPLWVALMPGSAVPTGADRVWAALTAALVDQRSYPLFAMLFGFGLATMAKRRIESTMRAAEAGLHPEMPPQMRDHHLALARRAATVDARRLVRRRGLWMLLFGAAHALVFSGDIIGTYALIAVLFAGLIVNRRWVWMIVVGVLVTLVCLWMMFFIGWLLSGGPAAIGVEIDTSMWAAFGGGQAGLLLPLFNLFNWPFVTGGGLLASMVLPAAFLGVRLADTELMARPDRHRRTLVAGGLTCLLIGAAGAVPLIRLTGGSLSVADPTALFPSEPTTALPLWLGSLAPAIAVLAGLVGACGWLALLMAWAGPATTEPLRGARWLLSAVGRRSMTAYVGQSVLFALIFIVLYVAGVQAVGEIAAALIALAVWSAMAAVCAWMERSGRRGPLEVLLRRAVATSARPH